MNKRLLGPSARPRVHASPLLRDGLRFLTLGLIPSGWSKGLMAAYVRTGGPAEAVSYHGRDAWCVDLRRMRQVQQRISLKRHGRPSVESALADLALARQILGSALPQTRAAPSRWNTALLQEELMRLRICGLRWLAAQPQVQSRWLTVPCDDSVQANNLNRIERQMALGHDHMFHVLAVQTGLTLAAAPALCLTEAEVLVARSDSLTGLLTHSAVLPPMQARRQALLVAERLWRLVDAELPEASWVGPASSMFPSAEGLTRFARGRRNMPEWLAEKAKVEAEPTAPVDVPAFNMDIEL